MVIQLNQDTTIKIGALGQVPFRKGIYYYIGSAMGATGSSTLINRVKRHISDSSKKKIHWHVDYFLHNKNTQVIKIKLIPSSKKIECIVAQEIKSISKEMLETLAIIAYKQPIILAQIDEFRGVSSRMMLAKLMKRNLVKPVGRKELPGRPLLYGTTDEFLMHFGLKSLSDLPTLTEIEEFSYEDRETSP